MPVKVLFIGGTGIISSACAELAVQQGIDLYLLNRGKSTRKTPAGAKVLRADIREPESVKAALGKITFDCVVDFIAFTPENVQTDIELFMDRTAQYIFISSASVYRKPPGMVPVTESTFLANKYWPYSRNKIACEEVLFQAYRDLDFPATIVRPSHTYDKRLLPWIGGWTVIDRMLKGQKILLHGDGTTLWTLTHHADFAKGFNGLLANPNAVGESFHITTDEYLTWNTIHETFGRILGVEPNLFYAPTSVIVHHHPEWEGDFYGDKTHSMIFDNTKIKRFVPGFAATIPFAHGANEVIDYFQADRSRQTVDKKLNEVFDKIIEAQMRAY